MDNDILLLHLPFAAVNCKKEAVIPNARSCSWIIGSDKPYGWTIDRKMDLNMNDALNWGFDKKTWEKIPNHWLSPMTIKRDRYDQRFIVNW